MRRLEDFMQRSRMRWLYLDELREMKPGGLFGVGEGPMLYTDVNLRHEREVFRVLCTATVEHAIIPAMPRRLTTDLELGRYVFLLYRKYDDMRASSAEDANRFPNRYYGLAGSFVVSRTVTLGPEWAWKAIAGSAALHVKPPYDLNETTMPESEATGAGLSLRAQILANIELKRKK